MQQNCHIFSYIFQPLRTNPLATYKIQEDIPHFPPVITLYPTISDGKVISHFIRIWVECGKSRALSFFFILFLFILNSLIFLVSSLAWPKKKPGSHKNITIFYEKEKKKKESKDNHV